MQFWRKCLKMVEWNYRNRLNNLNCLLLKLILSEKHCKTFLRTISSVQTVFSQRSKFEIVVFRHEQLLPEICKICLVMVSLFWALQSLLFNILKHVHLKCKFSMQKYSYFIWRPPKILWKLNYFHNK